MSIKRSIPMIVAVALTALAACGDDDEAADDTAPVATEPASTSAPATSATPTTSAPATTPASATTAVASTAPTSAPLDDASLALSALLTIDDMPSGWTESSEEDDDEQDAENIRRISECSGLDAGLIGDEVLGDTKAESPEFESPDEAASVKHTLGLAPDAATAVAAITAIGDDTLPPCYEEAIRATFEDAAVTTDPADTLAEGMTLADIAMERIEPPVPVDADAAVWYSTTATLDYKGQPIEVFLDLLFTQNGRVLSQIEFDGTNARFPEEEFGPIVTAAEEKIDAIATT
jgi:hypothetical protein